MKAASGPLISLLATSRELAIAELYTFTLIDTSTLKYTSALSDIGPFTALGPKLKRGTVRSVIGVEVDTLSVSMLVNPTLTVANIPMTQFVASGGFDGARLTLERSFASSWANTPAGNLPVFSGRVSDIDITGSEIALQVRSDLELLDVMMPRNIYQATCLHSLYDAQCGLVAANFTSTANVSANSTTTQINSNLAQADGYFDFGSIRFTTGQNTGVRRTVKRYASGAIYPVPPLPYVPASGDHFDAKPGCDKLQATCNAKFSNTANFRAYPYIPVPESAY